MNRTGKLIGVFVQGISAGFLALLAGANAQAQSENKSGECASHKGYPFKFAAGENPNWYLPIKLSVQEEVRTDKGTTFVVVPIIERRNRTEVFVLNSDGSLALSRIPDGPDKSLGAYSRSPMISNKSVFSFQIHSNISTQTLRRLGADSLRPLIFAGDRNWFRNLAQQWLGTFMSADIRFGFYSRNVRLRLPAGQVKRSGPFWYTAQGKNNPKTKPTSRKGPDTNAAIDDAETGRLVPLPLPANSEQVSPRRNVKCRDVRVDYLFTGALLTEAQNEIGRSAVVQKTVENETPAVDNSQSTAEPSSASSTGSSDDPRIHLTIENSKKAHLQPFPIDIRCIDRNGKRSSRNEQYFQFSGIGRSFTISAPSSFVGHQCSMPVIGRKDLDDLSYLFKGLPTAIMFRLPGTAPKTSSKPRNIVSIEDLLLPNHVNEIRVYRHRGNVWAAAGSSERQFPDPPNGATLVDKSTITPLDFRIRSRDDGRHILHHSREPSDEILKFDLNIPGFKAIKGYKLPFDMFDGPHVQLQLPEMGAVKIFARYASNGRPIEFSQSLIDRLKISLDGKRFFNPSFHFNKRGHRVAHFITPKSANQARRVWLTFPATDNLEIVGDEAMIEDGNAIHLTFWPTYKIIRLSFKDLQGKTVRPKSSDLTIIHDGIVQSADGLDNHHRFIKELRIGVGEKFSVKVSTLGYKSTMESFTLKKQLGDYSIVLEPVPQ